MKCICCKSKNIFFQAFAKGSYYQCYDCNLIFVSDFNKFGRQDNIKNHYLKVDPHKKVAAAKSSFFNYVINFLSSQFNTKEMKLLDVGCGFGYFLKLAGKSGWQTSGVDIVSEAISISKEKLGKENIFKGELKEACFSDNYFDAVTLLDVIAIVDNPHEELEECFRIMKNGGKIGIRTRNVSFQKIIFKLYAPIRRLAYKFGVKEPYVFNRYCFSAKSLYVLLSRIGFLNIQIVNSPLTSDNPYGHLSLHLPIRAIKVLIEVISNFLFNMSGGKWIIGPSLLVWAEKPKAISSS